MAKGRKTGGNDFKDGNPGGPGRPTTPDEVKLARSMNQVELSRILNDLIYCSKDELKAKLSEPSISVFELAIGSIIKNAVEKGDQTRIAFLLERLVGKPKETIEIQNPYNDMSLEELMALAKEKLK
jgi:hypothetical protein